MNGQMEALAGSASSPVPTFHDRRRDHRRLVQAAATLTVLDGPLAGLRFDVQTRNISQGGICFLLRQALNVGQTCRIDVRDGRPAGRLCEVVRSRPLSNGRYEMAVKFR